MTAFGTRKTGAAIRALAAGLVFACLPPALAAADPAPPPLHITSINNGHGKPAVDIGLGKDIGVVLDTTAPIDASKYVLFLNGVELDGLVPNFDPDAKSLVFQLQRNDKNTTGWKTLLGSPKGFGKHMTVALGEMPATGSPQPDIKAATPAMATFWFVTISGWNLILAVSFIGFLLFVTWGSAKRSSIIKDNQIPQIDPARQCYSLGRWQMAFWFTLIFASYIFLYIVLGDVNTLTSQALMLMGISGTTALAAVAVDAVKDSPADSVNAGLKLLGIKTYSDVLRIQMEIADREKQLAALPMPAQALIDQLTAEILDRRSTLRTYEEAIAGFVTEGFYKDLVSDLNGPALHRLQVLFWTVLLGVIFLIGVWQNLTMPEFSATLLAVMGISGAGYIGFKYPEAQ